MNDIAIDADGLMWIGTSGGVAVFDGADGWVVFTSKNSPLPAGNIYKVANDKKGNHWFGNDSKGVARLSGFTMPVKAVASASRTDEDGLGREGHGSTTAKAVPEMGEEKVRINPHLQDGYVTITMESPQAVVTFTNNKGKVVKTITNYKNNQRIAINKMPRGMYMVGVKTVRGEKKIKFNLK